MICAYVSVRFSVSRVSNVSCPFDVSAGPIWKMAGIHSVCVSCYLNSGSLEPPEGSGVSM